MSGKPLSKLSFFSRGKKSDKKSESATQTDHGSHNNTKSSMEETSKKSHDHEGPAKGLDHVIVKVNGATYKADKVVGTGSFGVVVRAVDVDTNEQVAIKKVLQDRRYKNRELQIMQTVNHTNVVRLVNHYHTNGDKADEVFLNLVLEFVPDTVYRVARQYSKLKQPFPILYTKLYIYQLLRSLNYIHGIGICHRDIKPQNLLLDPTTGVLKLCDFGSAKALVVGEPNVAYICSRYYRAPELIFGSTQYTTSIDIWSAGCVMAELLLGQPMFPGDTGIDQLVEIIKVLGTPTKDQIKTMNSQNYTEYKFPPIKGHAWAKVFRKGTPPEAIDLVDKLLTYVPDNRIKPFEGMAHPFFDELRDQKTVMPNGRALPELFNFTPKELEQMNEVSPQMKQKLIPSWYSPES